MQDETEEDDIFMESVVILEALGLSLTRIVICLLKVMISVQEVAVALLDLPDAEALASSLVLLAAFVIAFLLDVRLLAFVRRLDVLLLQEVIAVTVSSSNFLQILKLPVQRRSCFVMAFELAETLHFFKAVAVLARVVFVQQVHFAESVVFLRHEVAIVLKVVTSLSHSFRRVMFGLGKFAGLQEALIFSSQPWRTLVRFVSCFAPEFV